MRPRYESKADLANQDEIARIIGAATRSTPRAVPAHYAEFCDVVFERDGRLVSFCEIKRRRMTWGQYPDIVLAVHKWMRGAELVRSTLRPWVFAVGVDGPSGVEVYALTVKPSNVDELAASELRFGGRTSKTRDRGDVEPVIYLPCSRFRRIGAGLPSP
jgi:hypothetical protein